MLQFVYTNKCRREIEMTISERLFSIMQEKNISMPELSRMTGISRHTIYDWQKKNTNPGADKIMVICDVLRIRPEELLAGNNRDITSEYNHDLSVSDIDKQIMNACQNLSNAQKKRLLAYMSMLQNMKE